MFIDVHAHVYRYPYPSETGMMLFPTPEELDAIHRELDIDRAVLLPIITPEIYVPQSVGEVIEIAAASGGRLIPFCNVDPRALTNSSDAPLGRLLEHYWNLGCRGIGEVMPNLPWSDARMQNLLRHVQAMGFPLIFDMTGHLDRGYGIYDDPGMPQLEACLNRFPDLLFVGHGPAFWAEIAPLRSPEDRYTYPKYPVEREGRVAHLLRTYPNLVADLSAGSGANALLRDPDYTVAFLNEFGDRLMFGTDICYRSQRFATGALLQELKAQGKISAEAFDAIAGQNAIRLLGL